MTNCDDRSWRDFNRAFPDTAKLPSYEDVIKDIEDQLPPKGASPQQIIDSITSLPPSYQTVLAEQAGLNTISLTEKQSRLATLGASKTASTEDAAIAAKDSARQMSKVVDELNHLFIVLIKELTAIDRLNAPPPEGPFTPPCEALFSTFRTIISDSRKLAENIATYGERFDKIIIKFCADTSISTEDRKFKISSFISQAQDFEREAHCINKRFCCLSVACSKFIATFDGWAIDKIAKDSVELQNLKNDLLILEAKITKVRAAQLAMAAVSISILPITGILAALYGPVAPLIMIGGLIAAGVSLGTTVGLAVTLGVLDTEKIQLQGKIDKLGAGIQEMKATQTKLARLGSDSLEILTAHLKTLGDVWQGAKSDATSILGWLEGGAQDADRPEYMKMNLDEAVRVYVNMARYLRDYSHGTFSDA